MFGGKKESFKAIEAADVNTLIGEGCTFEGNLNLSTSTRIDGRVKGNIKSEGTLVIGETGRVEGDIQCTEILIYGTVNGNVDAQRIELKKGAALSGDVRAEVFVIEEGATYNGHCSMGRVTLPETSEIKIPD
ncbi:cytoskeletal protein CcmA (bactofilin family) [Hydrogenivirga caldilitoris]|uniref:Cytoskeletal protein CcmA (Bactofilin family) n=1 Tax=Hydrogenivirga caldilitoris TaxID=246264 RepID=A0A497XP72_9AQUI|nr:polymer-forming cytoskeletal protein [Hydrogenivirga caldilitoris]RLJ70745.1 cytoskeletal protein CcmA (bactofilin family) [Hydrogenivirga caldilitoris]